jgi:hypothetical protein
VRLFPGGVAAHTHGRASVRRGLGSTPGPGAEVWGGSSIRSSRKSPTPQSTARRRMPWSTRQSPLPRAIVADVRSREADARLLVQREVILVRLRAVLLTPSQGSALGGRVRVMT